MSDAIILTISKNVARQLKKDVRSINEKIKLVFVELAEASLDKTQRKRCRQLNMTLTELHTEKVILESAIHAYEKLEECYFAFIHNHALTKPHV
jgi:uncharacterized protein with PIN domain